MIHLITAANRHLYPAELKAMHVERKRQFIDARGWSLCVREDGEYDAYDDDAAAYLIGFTPGGQLAVSARIRPTQTGGVIPDIFPALVDASEPPSTAAGTYECTRYFTAPNLRGVRGFEARSKLHIALLEAMQDLGGCRLLGLSDPGLLAHLQQFSGLSIRQVGLAAPYPEGGEAVAFEIALSPAALQEARARLHIHPRQLFVAPAWLPAGFEVLAIERATKVLLAAPDMARRRLKTAASRMAAEIIYQPDVPALLEELRAPGR